MGVAMSLCAEASSSELTIYDKVIDEWRVGANSGSPEWVLPDGKTIPVTKVTVKDTSIFIYDDTGQSYDINR